MSWFKWLIGNYKKVSLLKVDYELITQSGKCILTIREDYNPNKNIIGQFGDFGEFRFIRKLEKDKDLVLKFDKRAEELLNFYQKEKRTKLRFGFIDGGDYIVKCIWDLWIDTEWLTYKEYRDYLKTKKVGEKNEYRKQGKVSKFRSL